MLSPNPRTLIDILIDLLDSVNTICVGQDILEVRPELKSEYSL